ncbi:NAD(P)-dependent dehydrogenase (short-subunit alcohol dehydrogenase family) [Neorhizobium galegae]|nr:SDR family oxidoreductase [Neorhizobium galegae]MDQ0135689.1 NAD(P)-dependent dehydrogenase (short-subunit alcohol dehydrogenase family) [Neorhizobium galegae]
MSGQDDRGLASSHTKQSRSQTALGRVGEPEEIGGVVASLLSAENRWINAQNIEVSGGYII